MIQQFRSDKRGMTLVELILATVLLSVVILTGLSMELGIRRIFTSTDLEAQLLAEAVPIMAMVAKDINQAVGDVVVIPTDNAYNPVVSGGVYRYQIRRDISNNGTADASDIFVEYRYNATPYSLEYTPNMGLGVYSLLSDRVAAFFISTPVNGTSIISLTLRKDASVAANYTNPQVTLNSRAQYRGYSYN